MTTDHSDARPAPASLADWVSAREVVALLLVLGLSVSLSTALLSPSARDDAVLTLMAVIGAAAVALALISYESFVLGFILFRPVLDVFKVLGLDPRGLLPAGAAALVVGSGIVWLAAQGRAGTARRPSLLSRALLVFTAALLLSALLGDDPVNSGLEVARVLTAVVLLLVLEQMIRSWGSVRRILAAALGSAVVPLAFGAYQLLSGDYVTQADGVGRVTGTFVHPNTFGFYLVMIMLMATATYRHTAGRWRAALGVLLLVASVELVFTYSRGSWIVLVVGLLVLGVLQMRKILLMLPVAVGIVLVAVPSVVARLGDLVQTESATGTPGNSLFWRFEQWSASVGLVEERWLTGIGPGVSDVLLGRAPHNDAVRMYTEGGVLGLLAYLLVLAAMVWTAVVLVRGTRAGSVERSISVGLSAVIAAFIVDSAGANLINQITILSYVVVFAAVAMAAERTVPAGRHPALRPAGTPSQRTPPDTASANRAEG